MPDPKRRDINDILQEYGLKAYDEFELLKRSGARLPIDSYEFVNPIFPEDESILRKFYVSGVRHCGPCEGDDCSKLKGICVGDELNLSHEPDNVIDSNAVIIFNKEGMKIGYVPSYYCKAVVERLKKGMTYSCTVLEVNLNRYCRECVKV